MDTTFSPPVNNILLDYYQCDGHKAPPVPATSYPSLFAEYRPEFCEVLKDHHASYQRAIWQEKTILYDIQLGQYGVDGSIFDGQICITKLGSGQTRDKPSGLYKQTTNHSFKDAAIRAYVASMKERRPFLLASDNKCTYLPTIPRDGVNFLAIDYFVVSYVWPEKRNGFVQIKGKFEKLDISTPSVVNQPLSHPPYIANCKAKDLVKATQASCIRCKKSSHQVYAAGWGCLNLRDKHDNVGCIEATNFQQSLTDGQKNEYDPPFLAERLDRTDLKITTFCPPMPANDLLLRSFQDKATIDPSISFRATTCCSCGRALQRVILQGWTCICGFEIEGPIPKVALADTVARAPIHSSDPTIEIQTYLDSNGQPKTQRGHWIDLIESRSTYSQHGYNVTKLVFREAASPTGLSEPIWVLCPGSDASKNRVDTMYDSLMQLAHDGDLAFERKYLNQDNFSKGQRIGYYSWQGSTHYENIVARDTTHREEWPSTAEDAYTYLDNLTKLFVGEELHKTLNELMVNIYAPGVDIAPHGDKKVQGSVPSLSLGADGDFDFMPSPLWYFQKTQTGWPGQQDEAPPYTWLRERMDEYLQGKGDERNKTQQEAFERVVSN